MFKKLLWQMTFFCTLITTLILAVMSCVCMFISETSLNKLNYALFNDNLNSFLTYLENQTLITHTWLAKTEASSHFKIELKDNGQDLLFHTLEHTPEKSYLFTHAREIAYRDYGLDTTSAPKGYLTAHNEFRLKDQNSQNFLVSVAILPRDYGFLSATVLYSLEYQETQVLQQRIMFGLVILCAIPFLFIFSWLFTKHMIKPLNENQEKQVQFIASVSHELRTPLTGIRTSLSALKIARSGDIPRFTQSIEYESKRMSRLINDMLTLANADAKSWTIHLEDVELDTLTLQVYEKFEPLFSSNSIRLSVSLPDHAFPLVCCDEGRIFQVLSILLDNALSYTPRGGSAGISLTLEEHFARIYISDNGIGIPDEQKQRIFERFYRLDKSHQDREHFGLGLSIAKEIIQQHLGDIRVQDSMEGGTVFIVSLPLKNHKAVKKQ